MTHTNLLPEYIMLRLRAIKQFKARFTHTDVTMSRTEEANASTMQSGEKDGGGAAKGHSPLEIIS